MRFVTSDLPPPRQRPTRPRCPMYEDIGEESGRHSLSGCAASVGSFTQPSRG